MKIIFSDIDGTLLNSQRKISDRNLKAIEKIKKNNCKLVLATGRNLFSTQKVIFDELDIDYLIFSTGVAISDFKTKKIISSYTIDNNDTFKISKKLLELNLNFFVHFPAPENHHYYYHCSRYDKDFQERFELYKKFSNELADMPKDFKASQFVIVLPYDFSYFERIKNKIKSEFGHLSYIRATSPLDHKHIWLEIYPNNVSKGNAIKELCEYLNVDLSVTMSIGNDYNDLSMLEITKESFLVANAPEDIKKKFKIVSSNDENGFAEAVDIFFAH
jgi:hypothetical protein